MRHDVLIIGSGAAGLSLALSLPNHLRVAVLSKDSLNEGSTYYAQGGISAVVDHSDSIESHVEDTLTAGAGLCDTEIVTQVVSKGEEAIQWLMDKGVPFTRNHETPDSNQACDLHLTREGGHSNRRVAHADDASGKAIEVTLLEQVQARTNIELHEHHIAIDLITTRRLGRTRENRCLGAYVLNRTQEKVITFSAGFTVLATGGASKVYLYTSNPDGASGDGIAMGWRAGCRVANMEFMQFHPTCLYHPDAKSFLISEAVRGEGAVLVNSKGVAFMEKYHPDRVKRSYQVLVQTTFALACL